jgi:hypothetical protein
VVAIKPSDQWDNLGGSIKVQKTRDWDDKAEELKTGQAGGSIQIIMFHSKKFGPVL